MDLGPNLNLIPLFYKWDGELPGPAQACPSPFLILLFPSVTLTFHLPVCQSHFAVCLLAPDGDCDILLLPSYSAPFLFYVSPSLLGIDAGHSCDLSKQ